MPRVDMLETLGRSQLLGIDQLQFIALGDHHRRISFRADTQPVDTSRCRQGAVGFHPHFETGPVEGLDQRFIQLQ